MTDQIQKTLRDSAGARWTALFAFVSCNVLFLHFCGHLVSY